MTTAADILKGIEQIEAVMASHPDGAKAEPILDRLYAELEALQDKADRRARIKSMAQVAA